MNWTASTDNVGVRGYFVERCTGAGCGAFAMIATLGAVTTYTDNGLSASASYSYRVRATDAAGNLSGYSNVASATTQAAPAISVSVSPSAANLTTGGTQNFTATVQNDPQNKGVSWSVSGAGCSGAACGTLGGVTATSVTYTAPANAPTPATVTVTAISQSDTSKSASATVNISAPGAISVSVSPGSANVQAGIGSQGFTATLTNDTSGKGVMWSLSGPGCSGASCGSLTGVTTTSVTYNAPTNAPSPATVTLTATSVADSTKSNSAAITVTAAVSVSVSPVPVSLNVGMTQQFTATVSNDSQNLGVTWSVNGVAGGNATVGTVSGSGLYTAPGTPPGSSVTVTATSKADTSRSASATVTVLAAVSVGVSPPSATVQVGQTQNFTATVANDPGSQGVTWTLSGAGCSGASCGTLSSVTTTSVTYTAPATLPSPAGVTLTATSKRDGTKSAAATITLTTTPVISVSVSPGSANVQAGIGNQGFTATLTNDSSGKGVTWSLSGAGCSGASCGSLTGVTTTSVTYNAPTNAPSPATVTLTATSVADSTKSNSAAITVTAAVSVSVSPVPVSLNVGMTQQFTATVSNDSQNLGVTWSVNGVSGGNATVGTVSGSGLYTAPATPPGSSVTVTATSKADTSRSGSATVTVLAAVSVGVSPSSATVQVSQTQGFTATVTNDPGTQGVTWGLSGAGCSGASCGTLSSVTTTSVTYTAPGTLPSPASVTLTATSKRDGTKSAAATITLTTAPVISVSVSPGSANVQAGTGSHGFTATLTNDSSGKGVTWSLSGPGCSGASCGSLTGVTTTSVTYNAPTNAPSPAAVTLTATSVADSTKSASTTITITPAIGVSVSPNPVSLNVSTSQQFTATVSNDSQNLGVTWSVNGVAGGNATVGTVSGSGLYTAPGTPPGSSVTVTATSKADTSRSASATVTVLAAVSVGVSPPSATVQVGQTQNFTATVANDPGSQGVTWTLSGAGCSGASCGTLSSVTTTSVTYTAPATLPSPASVTLTATSKRDGTKSATAAITLTAPPPITVSISPNSISVATNGTQNFTATVTNDSSGKGVTWALSGAGCSGATCGALGSVTTTSVTYTAPASVPAPATVTLTATSIADGTKTGSATITVTSSSSSITVSVSPKRGGLTVSQTLSLTATLTNDTGNQGVKWSFTSTGATTGGGFSPTSSTSGNPVTFTAPSAAGVVTITATSVADSSKTATAVIGVTDLAGVTTYLNGNSRQGGNTHEFALTPSGVTAVNSTNFGKLFSCAVDAAVYAQPLWVANLSIAGGTHNVVFVATQHDTVYAFDADGSSCVTLWQLSLIDAAHGGTPFESWVTTNDTGCSDTSPDVGITGTPVIDLNTNTLYAVSKSRNSSDSAFFQRIHAIDISTGSEKFSGPATISASVSGTGVGSVGGKVSFDPLVNNQRPALLLVNGHVIISWASHCDQGAYHGWVMSYSASSLAQEAVFNTSPNGINAGIWMSGGAPAADASGNIYFSTGNGTFDANTSGADYGDAMLKLAPPSGGSFGVSSYFRGNSIVSPDTADFDQGSGDTMLLPAVGTKNYLVQAGKDGNIYVMDSANLGGYNASSNQMVQELAGALPGGMWGSPTYWNGSVYFGPAADDGSGVGQALRAFSFDLVSSATLSASPTSQTSNSFAFPGPTAPISSNGTSDGILWALDNSNYCTNGSRNCAAAVLHAYDATNLVATELWNSSQGSGNAAGNAVKFTVPTVANGKVYVGTRGNDTGSGGTSIPGELEVYGFLAN